MNDYGKAIQTCLGARAVWEPGASVSPGDYGQILDGCFVRLGSLGELGVSLSPHEVVNEGRYQFSRGLSSQQGVSATTAVEWTGELLASINWAGGAGVFLGAPTSDLLTIADLGRVVRATLATKQWGFSWRLVRQVRTLTRGIVVLGGNSATTGKLALETEIPAPEAKISAGTSRASGFNLVQRGVTGAVYAHTVRLRPWLAHGSAPMDHELWYEDDLDDE